MLSRDAREKIKAQLSSGETLLWAGAPRRGIIFRESDWLLIPFSLAWGGFAMFWTFSVISIGAPWSFILVGALFVVIGLYLIVGRFIYDATVRKHTYYAVSSDRVVILSEFPTSSSSSIALSTLMDLSFNSKPDRSGTITFGAYHPMYRTFAGFNWPGARIYRPPSFEFIDDVKSVYDIVQKAKRDRKNGRV